MINLIWLEYVGNQDTKLTSHQGLREQKYLKLYLHSMRRIILMTSFTFSLEQSLLSYFSFDFRQS